MIPAKDVVELCHLLRKAAIDSVLGQAHLSHLTLYAKAEAVLSKMLQERREAQGH